MSRIVLGLNCGTERVPGVCHNAWRYEEYGGTRNRKNERFAS